MLNTILSSKILHHVAFLRNLSIELKKNCFKVFYLQLPCMRLMYVLNKFLILFKIKYIVKNY